MTKHSYFIIIFILLFSSCAINNDCGFSTNSEYEIYAYTVDGVDKIEVNNFGVISFHNDLYFEVLSNDRQEPSIIAAPYEYAECELTVYKDDGTYVYESNVENDFLYLTSTSTPSGSEERMTADAIWSFEEKCEGQTQIFVYCIKEDPNEVENYGWFTIPRGIVIKEVGLKNLPTFDMNLMDSIPDPFVFLTKSSEDLTEYLSSEYPFVPNSTCDTICYHDFDMQFNLGSVVIYVYDDNSEQQEEPVLLTQFPFNFSTIEDQMISKADVDSIEANGIEIDFQIEIVDSIYDSKLYLSDIEFIY